MLAIRLSQALWPFLFGEPGPRCCLPGCMSAASMMWGRARAGTPGPSGRSEHPKCSFRHLPLKHCCYAMEQNQWLLEFLPVTSQVSVAVCIES